MRHALEPDHLAAISTLVIESRSSRRGAWLGAFWGIGHATSLFVVGSVLALLETQLPARVADLFELGVTVLLVGFGVRAVVRASRLDGAKHTHGAAPIRNLPQSALVGIVHGLAGSGVITALVVASLPSTSSRLVYIALFGLGSTAGMALLSAVAGWPLARLGRTPRLAATISVMTGSLSVALGLIWGWPVVHRLLLQT
jgi:hypothetical protein